ncbi:MAG: hypothetical protein NTV34_18640 [Proteobacteria bacterium]|nr:hypothetical protein [Pseudomonadota bacterium]
MKSAFFCSGLLMTLIAGLSAFASSGAHAASWPTQDNRRPASERGTTGVQKERVQGPNFNIKAPPTSGDWQRFHSLSETSLVEIWDIYSKQGFKLRDWAWQWRLGWLRACGSQERWSWCSPILRQGLADQALVVRAEAAEQFALARAKKADKSDILALTEAYQRPDNFRHGRPLFVCERILGAMAKLGQPEAFKAAAKLAKTHKTTLAYWNTLNAVGQKRQKSPPVRTF